MEEKYKKVWQEFKEKIATLKRRQFEILSRISQKLDQQKIGEIMDKLKNK